LKIVNWHYVKGCKEEIKEEEEEGKLLTPYLRSMTKKRSKRSSKNRKANLEEIKNFFLDDKDKVSKKSK